jgi:hypothetical protein
MPSAQFFARFVRDVGHLTDIATMQLGRHTELAGSPSTTAVPIWRRLAGVGGVVRDERSVSM